MIFVGLLHPARMARSREWGGEPELLMPLFSTSKMVRPDGRKVCSGKLTCVSAKTWNIICQMKFFVFFLPFFLVGYEWIWQPCRSLYIYIHTQDSRYITYPKKCVTNDGKFFFSRWRFSVNVQASPPGGGPLLVGRIHISHNEHRLS